MILLGGGLAVVFPASVSADGVASPAGVGMVSAQEASETNDSGENASATGMNNQTSLDPRYEDVTVRIEDTRPFEFGTTVLVREETVLSMTFGTPPSEISGNVSVSESSLPAVDGLAANRSVHRAVDITVPEAATETPATMQMVVRALPVANRENLEVMRYDAATDSWQPLETRVASERRWSSDRGASVFLLEAETPGFSTFAVTEPPNSGAETNGTSNVSDIVTDGEGINETDSETINESELQPHPDATTVWINDRRPYTAGTTVEIQEETVQAITFAAREETIRGFVAVNDSTSTALEELRTDRTVLRAVNITATENASRTPATLHLAVRALPFEDGSDPEVMRYDDEAGSWEALQTQVVSERFWSDAHDASIFRVEAETSGFSTFAVTKAPEPTQTTASQSASEPTDKQSSTQPTEDSGLLFGFGLFEIAIVALVVAGGAGAVFVVRRR